MEDQKTSKPVDIIAPSATPQEAPAPETPSEEKKEQPQSAVTLYATKDGETKDRGVRFHTPTLLKEVEALEDGCTVKLTVLDPGKDEPRTLIEGTKSEAVAALKKSIVPTENLAVELRKFAQFLLDHSSLKAIGCHAVCMTDDGKEAGFGFVTTAYDCTLPQAVALVNCGDANIDEFITKAKLEVPGRNGDAPRGTVVTPTPEQVEKLG